MPSFDALLPVVDRKRTGAWYSPGALVDHVVAHSVGIVRPGRPVRVLDPACGDGRFLLAAAAAVRRAGGVPVLTGVDIDLRAARGIAESTESMELIEADALARDWGDRRFDVIVGNPPFLSQLASVTARDGGSRFGGGPYADAAADFLALAARLVDDGGHIGLVLPTSLLTARDAAPIRHAVAGSLTMEWFWSAQEPMFDAAVRTCAVGLRRGEPLPSVARFDGVAFEPITAAVAPASTPNHHWAWLIADSHGLPPVPAVETCGVLADHALVTANFRDQYYGLVGAVDDHADGPPLITTGLIDAGECHWGRRRTRFAKQRFEAPRVALGQLAPFMQRWAQRCLVPKVLVATQTRVLEAVVDETGSWLPAVPVIRVVPGGAEMLWSIAAVLTSPTASLLIAAQSVGSGLSADTVRVSQRTLGALPWPAGEVADAVTALRAGDLGGCGRLVDDAYSVEDPVLTQWWLAGVSKPARS